MVFDHFRSVFTALNSIPTHCGFTFCLVMPSTQKRTSQIKSNCSDLGGLSAGTCKIYGEYLWGMQTSIMHILIRQKLKKKMHRHHNWKWALKSPVIGLRSTHKQTR